MTCRLLDIYQFDLCILFFHLFFFFLGLHPWYLEVPRLGVGWELQLPAHTTATATPDPSHICGLHCSFWHCQILNPLSEASEQTCILMDPSQVCYCWATIGTPWFVYFIIFQNLFVFYFFCLFRAAPVAYGSSQTGGPIGAVAAGPHHTHSNATSKLCLLPPPQLHSNAGFLTHWARPGTKPASSWIPVGFVTPEPQWELLVYFKLW